MARQLYGDPAVFLLRGLLGDTQHGADLRPRSIGAPSRANGLDQGGIEFSALFCEFSDPAQRLGVGDDQVFSVDAVLAGCGLDVHKARAGGFVRQHVLTLGAQASAAQDGRYGRGMETGSGLGLRVPGRLDSISDRLGVVLDRFSGAGEVDAIGTERDGIGQ